MKIGTLFCGFICALATTAVHAKSNLQLEVTIPRLQVAEYHQPYVAVWLENSQRKVTQIAVWYDIEMENGKGEEWLADLRQWWRRGGRKLSFPIDGITGATKGPGMHTVDFDLSKSLNQLPAGKYTLRIEAAREVGGRELLQIPITLPIDNKVLPLTVEGNTELGLVRLSATQ
ncbi:hypothetical protein DS2_12834 [Catenovulum agarivorans DS-2]|uniref:DUF2271 domain-containing protein n=1 Tax=Catenovulum agarivorans DS-2 TaxID=1328313 RepID=W7QBP8_9ALTE|nr:DUF2271 domain-containing protein [Catenovulum agarivorans]EWH09421.1 hypothetical protein DS2_12834 [Catenovulum agarivorans DS-2]